MRRIVVLGIAIATLVAWACGASAHGFLERAEPRVGSTLRTAPGQVRLWFSESLEPAFSSVRVVNETGQPVDRGDSAVDRENHSLLRVSLGGLAPGRYKVIWRVLSVDSHVTQGDFTFRVTGG